MRYGVGRDVQDKLAARSHARAAAAQASGRFHDEIVPVKTKIIDPKTEEEKAIVVSDDDGIRPGVTVQSLGQLRTVFKKDGTTTAGNSSQVRSFLFFLFFREGEREEVERGGRGRKALDIPFPAPGIFDASICVRDCSQQANAPCSIDSRQRESLRRSGRGGLRAIGSGERDAVLDPPPTSFFRKRC